METLAIKINDTGAFDAVIKNSLPDGGDLKVITKDNATNEGKPAAMLTFSVELPDGTIKVAQTVTTVKLLMSTLRVLEAKYGREV